MSPSMKPNRSNMYPHSESQQANLLSSCYVVDSSARLTGFHYSSTGAGGRFFFISQAYLRLGRAAQSSLTSSSSRSSIRKLMQPHQQEPSGIPEVLGDSLGMPSPPSSPPPTALTSANELALLRSPGHRRRRDNEGRRKSGRREGAAHHIREECERLFCETMRFVFLGEEGSTKHGSIGMDASTSTSASPPVQEDDAGSYHGDKGTAWQSIDAWLEIWDYAGGSSFRGFVGGNGAEKSLFVFFGPSVISRDLKQAIMALLELAEAVFAASRIVICLDRSILEADSQPFYKSLQWVGFDLITLDTWSHSLDTTSPQWLFLGLDV